LGSLTKSQSFSPELPELGLIRANWAQTGKKRDLRLILQSPNVQLVLINPVSNLNWKVWTKVELSASISLN